MLLEVLIGKFNRVCLVQILSISGVTNVCDNVKATLIFIIYKVGLGYTESYSQIWN